MSQANTSLASATENGFTCVEAQALLAIIANYMAGTTAKAALAAATSNGFTCVDFQALMVIIAYYMANGGGSGGGASFLSGSGTPVGMANATVIGQTYFDYTNNNFWAAFGTGTLSWTELIGN